MVSSFADEVDKSGAAVPSFSAPEGEEALVIAAKNGNDHAFETLVERYRRRMLTVALRLTRVQEDAEDITQQSFQKLSSICTHLRGNLLSPHGSRG